MAGRPKNGWEAKEWLGGQRMAGRFDDDEIKG
jgi:hypothetical protein